jgi:hypothetical protein
MKCLYELSYAEASIFQIIVFVSIYINGLWALVLSFFALSLSLMGSARDWAAHEVSGVSSLFSSLYDGLRGLFLRGI